MTTRMTVLLAFLAAFLFTTPVLAAPPEDDAKVDTNVADEGSPEPGESKTEPKSDEGKSDEPGAPAEIKSDEEALSALQQLMVAAKGGHWTLAVAAAVMLLVYVANKFGLAAKLGTKAVPWVCAGMAVGGYVAASLMVEGATVTSGVTNGIMAGATAVGLWEMLFKHFLGKKKPVSSGADT